MLSVYKKCSYFYTSKKNPDIGYGCQLEGLEGKALGLDQRKCHGIPLHLMPGMRSNHACTLTWAPPCSARRRDQ